MEEHDSRFANKGETVKWYGEYLILEKGEFGYVDSNNFFHNLFGPAYYKDPIMSFYIHGRILSKKDWLIEREEILFTQRRNVRRIISMKEHDSRRLGENELYYWKDMYGCALYDMPDNDHFYYVDSNNFLHNLEGYGIGFKGLDIGSYFIHGKYLNKEDWEIEANRISFLEEI